MEIHLRFYSERYNMDPDYYTGDEDIYKRLKFDDIEDLARCWKALVHDYEGETYSAWLGRGYTYLLCGGAFDPSDLENIREAYEKGERK